MIQINLSNKTAYTLILILAILSVSLVVYAVTPANPGHSSEQVNILINGEEKTLQSAIDSGDFLSGISVCTTFKKQSGSGYDPEFVGSTNGQTYTTSEVITVLDTAKLECKSPWIMTGCSTESGTGSDYDEDEAMGANFCKGDTNNLNSMLYIRCCM